MCTGVNVLSRACILRFTNKRHTCIGHATSLHDVLCMADKIEKFCGTRENGRCRESLPCAESAR